MRKTKAKPETRAGGRKTLLVPVVVKVTREERARLEAESERRGMPLSSCLRWAAFRYFDEEGKLLAKMERAQAVVNAYTARGDEMTRQYEELRRELDELKAAKGKRKADGK